MAKKVTRRGHKLRGQQPAMIQNRRARFDYTLGDSFVVGLELNGREAKSLRLGHGSLTGSYVTVKNGELFLINAMVSGSSGIPIGEAEQTRARKLLAKKREIASLIAEKQNGATIIPLEILTQSRYIKLKIAVAHGKKKYDKRQALKKQDATREVNRALKPH